VPAREQAAIRLPDLGGEQSDQYGHSRIQTLNVSIEVTSRLTSWPSSPDTPLPILPGTLRRLEAA
jgi:hypothetical protein